MTISVPAQKNARFDPDGSFWIIGDHGDGFSDFGGINLNAKRLRRLPPAGVQLNDGKTFRFKTLNVKRENFTFTTVAIGGVSYSFSGKFLRGGVFAATDLERRTSRARRCADGSTRPERKLPRRNSSLCILAVPDRLEMRILIVKLGSIGDVVHTLPALAALRGAMPQAEISWVVERQSSEILRDNPLLDRLIEVDTKALRRGLMSGETLRAPRQQLRRLRASAFDVALDFQGLLKSASIARLSGARRVFGYSRAGLREPASAIFLSKRVAVPEADARNP